MKQADRPIVIIGAGPSGLACAAALANRGFGVLVVERNDAPGGMCQSITVGNQVADLGNHLFSKRNIETNILVENLYPGGLDEFNHDSGFYWSGRLVPYPLSVGSTVSRLPWKLLAKAAGSLLSARIRSKKTHGNYKEYLESQYGPYLEQSLFSPYLAKTWGVNTSELSTLTQSGRAERIRGSFGYHRPQKFFDFPDGNGDVYRRWQRDLKKQGVKFLNGSAVTEMELDDRNITSISVSCRSTGRTTKFLCQSVVSTLPMTKLVEFLNKPELLSGSPDLTRTVVVVYLQHAHGCPLPFDTIYGFDPGIQTVRIAEYSRRYGNFQKDPDNLLRSGEYWMGSEDPRLSMSDSQWTEMLCNDLRKISANIGRPTGISKVIRLKAAAPVPTISAMAFVEKLREFVSEFDNLHVVGRAGDLRYIDQDAAISAGLALGRTIAFEGRV